MADDKNKFIEELKKVEVGYCSSCSALSIEYGECATVLGSECLDKNGQLADEIADALDAGMGTEWPCPFWKGTVYICEKHKSIASMKMEDCGHCWEEFAKKQEAEKLGKHEE